MAPGTRGSREKRGRARAAGAFRSVEYVLYAAVALALAVLGAILFGFVVFRFARDLATGSSFVGVVLDLLDGLLLVFIVTELLHTVRAVISENVLVTEPFLIVGIVAAIRRIIVITAEAPDHIATGQFTSLMLELGLLVGAVIALGATIFMLRHTEHPEPRPGHEPDQ